MSPEREQHLRDLKNLFLERIDSKYRKGAEEHDEILLEKDDLLDEAFNEILDLFVYIASELQRRKNASLPHDPHEDPNP